MSCAPIVPLLGPGGLALTHTCLDFFLVGLLLFALHGVVLGNVQSDREERSSRELILSCYVITRNPERISVEPYLFVSKERQVV